MPAKEISAEKGSVLFSVLMPKKNFSIGSRVGAVSPEGSTPALSFPADVHEANIPILRIDQSTVENGSNSPCLGPRINVMSSAPVVALV
jgi:hypothetical protein